MIPEIRFDFLLGLWGCFLFALRYLEMYYRIAGELITHNSTAAKETQVTHVVHSLSYACIQA